MYCRYRSSGLRAPAARQTRGVFHRLEPMKKRMICCTSILKVCTNFDEVTDKKIASIQKKINSRLRKKLKFETPKAEFFKRIA